jgi:hypothetical protein
VISVHELRAAASSLASVVPCRSRRRRAGRRGSRQRSTHVANAEKARLRWEKGAALLQGQQPTTHMAGVRRTQQGPALDGAALPPPPRPPRTSLYGAESAGRSRAPGCLFIEMFGIARGQAKRCTKKREDEGGGRRCRQHEWPRAPRKERSADTEQSEVRSSRQMDVCPA